MFGKEPNAFKASTASLIRITKTMIEPMGGLDSPNFGKFERKLCEAYAKMRNHREYIMNLMNLMVNSGLPDLPYAKHQEIL